MTETEVKQQTTRILAIFGFHVNEAQLRISIRHTSKCGQDNPRQLEFQTEFHLEVDDENTNLRLQVQHEIEATASTLFRFTMQNLKTGRTSVFAHMTPEQVVHAQLSQKDKFRMLLGLGRLGYNVVSFCENAGIPLGDQEKRDWTAIHQEKSKSSGFKAEFEGEARRILAAFGQDSQAPLEIQYHLHLRWSDKKLIKATYRHYLECSFTIDSFILRIAQHINADKDEFFINLREIEPSQTERKIANFKRTKDKQYVNTKDAGEYEPLLLRGLSNLGYDIISLCDQAGIPLSNHQKIEMALKYRKTNPAPNSPHD